MKHDVYVGIQLKADKFQAQMTKILQSFTNLKVASKQINGVGQKFQNELEKSFKTVKDVGSQAQATGQKVGNVASGGGGKFKKWLDDTNKNSRKMFMGLLSVMFGAQMVSKAMNGLLKPALEATGIFDLFSATLQVFFLPIALLVLQFLLPILQWFMDAPEPVKKVVGAIILFVAIFSAVIAVVTSVGLLIVGIIALFGEAAAVVAAVVAVIALFIVGLIMGKGPIGTFISWIRTSIWNFISWFYEKALKPFFNNVKKFTWDPLVLLLGGLFSLFEKPLMKAFNWIKDKIFIPLLNWFETKFITPFGETWETLIQSLIDAWNWFTEPIKAWTGKDWTVKGVSAAAGNGRLSTSQSSSSSSANNVLNNSPTNNFNISSPMDAELVSKKLSEDTNNGFLGLVRSWLTN